MPFATTQIRWGRNDFQFTCSDCRSYGGAETELYLRGEIGLSLQVSRFYVVAGYRAFLDEDPLFQLGRHADTTPTLLSLGAGFVF